MFNFLRKWYLKHFCYVNSVLYNNRVYQIQKFKRKSIILQSNYVQVEVLNKYLKRIKILKIRPHAHYKGEYVSYYDQFTDEMRKGVITQLYNTGLVIIDKQYLTHQFFINKKQLTKLRRYNIGDRVKYKKKWYIINDLMLDTNGEFIYFGETKDKLYTKIFEEEQIKNLNKKF